MRIGEAAGSGRCRRGRLGGGSGWVKQADEAVVATAGQAVAADACQTSRCIRPTDDNRRPGSHLWSPSWPGGGRQRFAQRRPGGTSDGRGGDVGGRYGAGNVVGVEADGQRDERSGSTDPGLAGDENDADGFWGDSTARWGFRRKRLTFDDRSGVKVHSLVTEEEDSPCVAVVINVGLRPHRIWDDLDAAIMMDGLDWSNGGPTMVSSDGDEVGSSSSLTMVDGDGDMGGVAGGTTVSTAGSGERQQRRR
ncbi:hypothetical protein ACLOJK_007278 [Asimina triloba]